MRLLSKVSLFSTTLIEAREWQVGLPMSVDFLPLSLYHNSTTKNNEYFYRNNRAKFRAGFDPIGFGTNVKPADLAKD